MSQVIKTFMGIFIVLFMMCSAVSILGAFFQTLQAQDFHALIIDELENSNFSDTVLENAIQSSQSHGYELEVSFFQVDGTLTTNSDEAKVCMAKVSLRYPVEIGFFQFAEEQTIIGYAR